MLLSNYLFFTTTCEQALAFYTRCGLGKVTQMMHYGVDGMPAATEPMRGSAHILMMDDREATDRLFGSLAEDGVVTTPLGIQPWGDYYGKLTDRLGVQWMLNFPIRSR